ncbi:MAG: serine hydrolase domain-containing protein, partial [Acidobacteriota bacterium]
MSRITGLAILGALAALPVVLLALTLLMPGRAWAQPPTVGDATPARATPSADDADALDGTWNGSITLFGNELAITVRLAAGGDDGAPAATIDIPVQGVKDLDLIDVALDENDAGATTATFRIPGAPGEPTFDGVFDLANADGPTLAGDFTQAGRTFPFALVRDDGREAAARAERLADYDALIADARQRLATPGVAVALIDDGEIVHVTTDGHRDLANDLPITEDTIFAIGSVSKSFTAATVALLVDDGLIEWDEPIRTYLPRFRMHDDVATNHINAIDLLVHSSGLPRHDLAWYGSDATREALVDGVAHLEPVVDFRGGWNYQNLMYMTAGYLVGQQTESRWEDVVRTRLF